jgi:maleylacetoacetate isomerase
MFRGKDNALQPNWLHLPVGYHGRASTVVISGTPIRRPYGQLQKEREDPKQGSVFGPCRLFDFELELASVVGGPPNPMGQPLTMAQAKERIFGFLLMNDWSARDIQAWEYVPLGPFTAKNLGTTLSPWIVTTEALQNFVGPTSTGPEQVEPIPLEYLQDPNYSSFDITLQVQIQGDGMDMPHTVCTSNFLNLYWNAAQQLVHHSVTGCVMNPGDLLGSGTISGQTKDSYGSMLELSWKGTNDVRVGNEVRKFLNDGDTVTMKGWCNKPGHGRVGFGECIGKVLPAKLPSDFQTEQPPTAVSRYQNLKLYSYWRSSSSWRVRIALNAKELAYDLIPINLKAGAHMDEAFLAKNPMGQVPVLEYTDTVTGAVKYLTQSVAIFEFLDLVAPQKKSLIPSNALDRVTATELVELINSGIQPLQNAPMVKNLERESEGKIMGEAFAQQHIVKGLTVLEQLMKKKRQEKGCRGPYCLGNFSPTIVEAFLVPQLYNARRFNVHVEKEYPILVEIEGLCEGHRWFASAHPDNQVDVER